MIINLYKIFFLICHVQTECQAVVHGRSLREISFETMFLNLILSVPYNNCSLPAVVALSSVDSITCKSGTCPGVDMI